MRKSCILALLNQNVSGALQLRGLGVSLYLSIRRSVISVLEGKAAKDSGEIACNPTTCTITYLLVIKNANLVKNTVV